MTRLEFRGPFLLLFALDQQLGTLLTRAMAQAPLRPGEFAVYSTLRLEQPTTPTELAATLGLRATTMSSRLAKMAELGHLTRVRNPRDGRSMLISLTPDGLAATEACFPGFQRAIQAFRKSLTVDEPTVLAILEAVGAALDTALDQLGDPPTDAERPPEGNRWRPTARTHEGSTPGRPPEGTR